MNLTEIQHKLDRCVQTLRSNEPGAERLAIVQLQMAVYLLVEELARMTPEHPELTPSNDDRKEFPEF